jgi:jumonji domain-containing protein 7
MANAATAEMLVTYHELNGDIEELQEVSPLDFMRFVAKNRPFKLRGGCSTWQATRKWNAAYLRGVMEDTPVNVATTPHGSV